MAPAHPRDRCLKPLPRVLRRAEHSLLLAETRGRPLACMRLFELKRVACATHELPQITLTMSYHGTGAASIRRECHSTARAACGTGLSCDGALYKVG